MTCPKCGGLLKVVAKDMHIEIDGYNIMVTATTNCEFCDHTAILTGEAELEEANKL